MCCCSGFCLLAGRTWIHHCDVSRLVLLASSLHASRISANLHSTLSWCHLYWPCISAALHPERMCCRLGLLELQSWHVSSVPYHRCKFQGLGRMSYMAQIMKLSLAWGILHVSPRDGSVDDCLPCRPSLLLLADGFDFIALLFHLDNFGDHQVFPFLP